jgi:hypothetical protein
MDMHSRCFRFDFDYGLYSSKYNFINTGHALLLILSEGEGEVCVYAQYFSNWFLMNQSSDQEL